MVKVNKIKGRLVEIGSSMDELAVYVGVDKSTIYRKFNDFGESLTIREATAIVEFLKLSKEEASDIFFASIVA